MDQEIIFPSRSVFHYAPCSERPPLGPKEVRGRTLASLISPGTELAWASGDVFPLRPGYASVFAVEECGENVEGVKPGAVLLNMGPHRSFQQVEAQFTIPVPMGLEPELAVLARLAGVSMTTLMTTKARPGDNVVICGAGPVGYLASYLFRISGYTVSVVEPDKARAQHMQEAGFSVFPAMPLEDTDLCGKVGLVIDCSGHEQAILDGCKVIRQHSEVVLIGVPWSRRADIQSHDLLQAIFNNFAVLRSGWEWELPILSRAFKWEELLEGYNNSPHSIFTGLQLALRWIAEGRIPTSGLVRTVSPSDPAAVYGALQERRITEPFVIFDWRSV